MNMEMISVITPTYNRKNNLERLYQSLCSQSNKNFCWIVVDDGSEDGTYEYLNGLKDNAPFQMKVYSKENGGKHTALNFGIRKISSDLTIIGDSDDLLLETAIDDIQKVYEKYRNDLKIGCFTFLRARSDGSTFVSLESDELIANYIQFRIKENRPGDMAEVFRTYILQENPFPVFQGERFLSEDVCWIEIGKKFDSVFINKAIYECEYLKGGLTDNDKPMKFRSPNGSMLRGKQLMYRKCGLRNNVKGAIIYNCYKHATDNCLVFPESVYQRILVLITKPLGWYFFKKWGKSKKR